MLVDTFLTCRNYQPYIIQSNPAEYTCVYLKRCLPVDRNGIQSATTVKSILSNTRYAAWNIDRAKPDTVGKSFFPNKLYTIRNIYRSKRRTALKNTFIVIIKFITANRV